MSHKSGVPDTHGQMKEDAVRRSEAFFGILSDEQRQRVDSFKFIRAAFMGGTALDELGL